MVTKTFSTYLWFVALLALVNASLWGRGTPNGLTEEKAQVTVSVYNDAAVPGEAYVTCIWFPLGSMTV